ncbi:alpha/beta hydrolase [Cellulosilyticum sp. I15G10I2]|uniref:alpha/beta hydrolase n=1 Tax=Cellulosilyticum sp. I15G10I2 TaxID=1892843 RepID=UPI0009F1B81C|nr:alpha/beta hydrolase [Cellulosilyticum sp. I15G10I2]
MINEVMCLKEAFKGLSDSDYNPTLSAYIVANSNDIHPNYKRPSVVICPGGGYRLTSDREAEPVALRFVAAGFNAFVLRYSVETNKYPAQLLEVSAAVAYIRKMANKWSVDENKIIVCGFSAGGHLAGSLGVFWNQSFIREKLGLEAGENKPNAMILSYPVITAGEFAHQGSFNHLLGPEASQEQRDTLSLENHVSVNTPPTFIWHTLDDTTVPVENALLFARALREKNILFELHIYYQGVHGLSLCDKTTAHIEKPEQINPHAATWFNLALGWLHEVLQIV